MTSPMLQLLLLVLWLALVVTAGRVRLGASHAKRLPDEGLKCNGRADLCHLKFDEITLLGSHNAPAYNFKAMGLYSSPTLNCAYSDHSVSETAQLDHRVRLLDIDTCLRDGEIYTCHGEGSLARIKNSLRDVLKSIATWVKEHPNEVIMISFGDHDPNDPADSAKVSELIAKRLDEFQREGDAAGAVVRTDDVQSHSYNYWGRRTWPTLRSMVKTGRRVVLSFEGDSDKPQNDLYRSLPHWASDFVFNFHHDFAYTWSGANEGKYLKLLQNLKYYCQDNYYWLSSATAIHLDAFMTLRASVRLDPKSGTDRIEHQPSSNAFIERNASQRLLDDASSDSEIHALSDSIADASSDSDANASSDSEMCFCTKCLARKFNEAFTRERGKEKTSALEESYRICAESNVRVHAVKVDYEQYGDLTETINRLNDRNVQRFCPNCELSQHSSIAASVNFPSALAFAVLMTAMAFNAQ